MTHKRLLKNVAI